MLISSTQVSFTVGSIFSLTGICFRMKFQTIFPQNRCLNSWYIQIHIFITTDPAKKMNFGAWNWVPIVVKLNSTGTTWDRNLWPVSYQIYFQQIYTFRHYFDSLFSLNIKENVAKNMDNIRDRWNEVNGKSLYVDKQTFIEKITPYCMHKWSFKEWMWCRFLKLSNSILGVLGGNIAFANQTGSRFCTAYAWQSFLVNNFPDSWI